MRPGPESIGLLGYVSRYCSYTNSLLSLTLPSAFMDILLHAKIQCCSPLYLATQSDMEDIHKLKNNQFKINLFLSHQSKTSISVLAKQSWPPEDTFKVFDSHSLAPSVRQNYFQGMLSHIEVLLLVFCTLFKPPFCRATAIDRGLQEFSAKTSLRLSQITESKDVGGGLQGCVFQIVWPWYLMLLRFNVCPLRFKMYVCKV